MKIHILLFSFVLLATGCIKKTVEQVQENIVIKAMTDGQWRVTHLDKAGVDKTYDFASYSFQFRANNTVEAMNNGTVENTGTWAADAAARTITATFTNASAAVSMLNGTWKITNNSWTYVEATQTVNGEVLSLRIDK